MNTCYKLAPNVFLANWKDANGAQKNNDLAVKLCGDILIKRSSSCHKKTI